LNLDDKCARQVYRAAEFIYAAVNRLNRGSAAIEMEHPQTRTSKDAIQGFFASLRMARIFVGALTRMLL
jgi:hypothetical protein